MGTVGVGEWKGICHDLLLCYAHFGLSHLRNGCWVLGLTVVWFEEGIAGDGEADRMQRIDACIRLPLY